MKRIYLISVLTTNLSVAAHAQTGQPFVISEDVQAFAIEAKLGDQLGIDWSKADPQDISRYVDYLTAIDIIANERAKAGGQEKPSFDDYKIAAGSVCRYPIPFKPPEVAKESDAVLGSFASVEKQEAVGSAIGPVLVEADYDQLDRFLNPSLTLEEYYDQVIDFNAIE